MARTVFFPATPHIGQLYTNNGSVWRWNGFVWEAYKGTSEATLQGRRELRAWHAALAKSGTTGARVLIVTDSMGTYNASTPKTNSWGALVDRALLSSIGIDPAVGWIPVREEAPTGYMPNVVPDTLYPNGLQWDVVNGVNSNTGPGGWGRTIMNNQICQTTEDGDGFILHYTKQQTNGARMTIHVDHGTGTVDIPIETNDSGLDVNEKSGYFYSYPNPNGFGPLEVTIFADNRVGHETETVKVDGIFFTRDNRSAGIRTVRANHEGWGFTDYCDIVNNKSTLQYVKERTPDVIITSLGINDYFIHGVNTPEAMKTLFNAWIDAVKLQYSPNEEKVSLVFAFPVKCDLVPSNWASDYKVMFRLACKEQGVLFIDMDEVVGPYGQAEDSDPLGIARGAGQDRLHPNNMGHSMMAQPVIEALRVGIASSTASAGSGLGAGDVEWSMLSFGARPCIVSATRPLNPTDGQLWRNTTDFNVYIYEAESNSYSELQ